MKIINAILTTLLVPLVLATMLVSFGFIMGLAFRLVLVGVKWSGLELF